MCYFKDNATKLVPSRKPRLMPTLAIRFGLNIPGVVFLELAISSVMSGSAPIDEYDVSDLGHRLTHVSDRQTNVRFITADQLQRASPVHVAQVAHAESVTDSIMFGFLGRHQLPKLCPGSPLGSSRFAWRPF